MCPKGRRFEPLFLLLIYFNFLKSLPGFSSYLIGRFYHLLKVTDYGIIIYKYSYLHGYRRKY